MSCVVTRLRGGSPGYGEFSRLERCSCVPHWRSERGAAPSCESQALGTLVQTGPTRHRVPVPSWWRRRERCPPRREKNHGLSAPASHTLIRGQRGGLRGVERNTPMPVEFLLGVGERGFLCQVWFSKRAMIMARDARQCARKFNHLLISEWVMIISFTVLVITTFLQVVFRYVVNLSLSWADELARYVFVWLVFSGLVVSFARGEHAIMNFVVDLYRGRFKSFMLALIDLLIFGLFVVLTISGVMLMSVSVGQSTAGLGIPKMVVYAALPFGSVMMLIELARAWCKRLTDTHEG